MTQSYYAEAKRSDVHYWVIALVLSPTIIVLLVIGFVLFCGFVSVIFPPQVSVPKAVKPPEATVQIYPDMLRASAAAKPPATPAGKAEEKADPVVVQPPPERFANTSDDQRSKRPDKPAFIGERDTEATSDRTPDPNAPPLPSQAGIEPRHEGDIETTESRFREGELPEFNKPDTSKPQPPATEQAAASQASPEKQGPEAAATPPSPLADPALAPDPAPAEQPAKAEKPTKAADPKEVTEPSTQDSPDWADEAAKPTAPEVREKLLEGPNPVETQVPKETSNKSNKPKPKDTTLPQRPTLPGQKPAQATKPKQAVNDPAFSGYQRKTAVRGSISRTGRSSLNVEDSPLGRYQALISRAVELEWQRNCVRHRDFITPGYLTIRFYVEGSGKVRSVQFVDSATTSEIQKGFTLNSIRDAAIPAMPPELRKDYAKEPLELIFNFYF